MERQLTQEQGSVQKDSSEAPAHLKGLQVLAEGYQYYMAYLKDGGEDGMSSIIGDLIIDG